MNEKICCVYRLEFPELGMFYIGGTRNLSQRIKSHMATMRQGRHQNKLVQQAWQASQVVAFGIIERCSEAELAVREEYYLSQSADNPFLLSIGLNARGGDLLTRHPDRDAVLTKRIAAQRERIDQMTAVDRKQRFGRPGEINPMFGKTHSEAVKRASSVRNQGRKPPNKGVPLTAEQKAVLSARASLRTGEKNSFFGRSHSEGTKQLLRELNKGKLPPNTKQVSIDGHEFVSATEAARQLGIPMVTVAYRCRSKTARWSTWKYVG